MLSRFPLGYHKDNFAAALEIAMEGIKIEKAMNRPTPKAHIVWAGQTLCGCRSTNLVDAGRDYRTDTYKREDGEKIKTENVCGRCRQIAKGKGLK